MGGRNSRAISYTDIELAWIKAAQKDMSRKELADKFNAKFNRNLSADNLAGLCKRNGWANDRDTTFKSGQKSWNKGTKGLTGRNKTTFKKGNLPHNCKPVGHEYTTNDGYIMIKVSEAAGFKLKHRHVWEQAHGPIPERHVIRFLDGDRSNCTLDNLICVPIEVNGVVNHWDKRFGDHIDINKAVLLTETINHHIGELERP
ncbi:MAG: HNH endonuclease signature motif containing protein [Psychrobacter sp.]|nr:HNH endonuclease signature motif containing protein [Psychrobacter sp.]